jgi:hypothetical protein
MDPVQITPKASQDIAKLAQGVGRVDVALGALTDSELSPEQVEKLEALLKKVSPTDGGASATKSEAVAEMMLVDGYKAVVGKIKVNGQQLETLLSEGSFNKEREDQKAYAKSLGWRIATREENRAYVDDLLAKEDNGTISDPEKNALHTYKYRYVRDAIGGLDVAGRGVRDFINDWDADGLPISGALFVRAAA